MRDSLNPEQPPSGPLYAPESAEPPAVGIERHPGVAPGPQTGAQALDAPELRRALARNAVGPALNERGEWLPLSVRQAVADAVLAAVDEQPPVNPPGSTREQLPAAVLALLPARSYLSTACEVARLLEGAAIANPERAAELREWRDRMQQRCRLNNKFTGALCTGPHHQEEA